MTTTTTDFETLKALCEKYRNWGRWGPDDQIGTLNFITREKVVQAARLVRKGAVISLAIPFDETGPQTGFARRINPMTFMLRDGRDFAGGSLMGFPEGFGGTDDIMMMSTHGATHWDALAHIIWDNRMWNGYDGKLVSSLGAERNGIQNFRNRIVSRGVLLDIPRSKGLDHLEVGYPITPDDLDAAARFAGVEVGTGDIVLVRTGFLGLCRARGSWGTYSGGDAPGLSLATAGWLHEKEVAGVAVDTFPAEVRPPENTYVFFPWHLVVIPNMGLLVGEIFDLEELSADCAGDGVYEFQFVAPPLPITRAVGSPINPVAIK